jgi:acetyl-CoA synthetase
LEVDVTTGKCAVSGEDVLIAGNNYADVRDRFQWKIPEFYNIGVDVCDKWADTRRDAIALVYAGASGTVRSFTFGELRDLSNRTANLLRDRGVRRGDRVGILLPQAPETAYAHIAVYKLAAIAVPLFSLFGPEALEYRLKDAGVSLVITNAEGLAKIASVRSRLPDLQTIFSIDSETEAASSLQAALSGMSPAFLPVETRPDDPALIIYTSGTTGMPKGALHAHRVLLGHLPGVELSHDFLPQPGDRIWTPADWAWIGGLLDVLLPALHHGVPVLAHRFAKFSGAAAFHLMRKHGVRNAFIPPTALKMMRAASLQDTSLRLSMRSVASGGEPLGSELLNWGRDALGVTINEFYGQTECNMVVSSCGTLMSPRIGAMGRPVPGHKVDVIDQHGKTCPEGSTGSIAVRSPDPVMFLGYWNNDAATRAKFRDNWLVTGDIGVRETDGWIRFVGREDDIITSAGYRIGPGEIEDCLLKHPAVQMAAVIGKPDPERTEIVKAYIVLKQESKPSEDLAMEISNFVKARLAAHEYPREIAFVDALPMTTTGKIVRRTLRERAASETSLEL